MKISESKHIVHLPTNVKSERHSAFVGTVTSIEDDGSVFVNYSFNSGDPQRALVALSESDCAKLWENGDVNNRVLLVDADHPEIHLAIVGLLSETLSAPVESAEDPETVHLDVTSLVLEARKDLVLRCGDSQLTMKADGKIVLRGTDVISRSSGLSRIRGASVRIN